MTREQFTDYVSHEQEGLRRFLLALCLGNRDEADDIAQDTLVKAFLSCAGYQDNGRFKSWLFTIAHRTFLDYKKTSVQSSPLETLSASPDTTFAADRDFRYQGLYQAMSALPPKERTSILLFYLQGYSVKEVSRIVNCSEDSVKKQLSRGREQLRKTLTR